MERRWKDGPAQQEAEWWTREVCRDAVQLDRAHPPFAQSPWVGPDRPLRLSWTNHRGILEKLRGDLPKTFHPGWGYRSRPPQTSVTYVLFCVPQGLHLQVDINLAEHTGFHPAKCWTFPTWKIKVREEGILQDWTTYCAEGKGLWCALTHQHVGFYNAHMTGMGLTLRARWH